MWLFCRVDNRCQALRPDGGEHDVDGRAHRHLIQIDIFALQAILDVYKRQRKSTIAKLMKKPTSVTQKIAVYSWYSFAPCTTIMMM